MRGALPLFSGADNLVCVVFRKCSSGFTALPSASRGTVLVAQATVLISLLCEMNPACAALTAEYATVA